MGSRQKKRAGEVGGLPGYPQPLQLLVVHIAKAHVVHILFDLPVHMLKRVSFDVLCDWLKSRS